MTSEVVGVRWNKHPVLENALAGPTPVKFYLKFVTWDLTNNTFTPVTGESVRVVKTNDGGTLQAIQTGSAVLTDLQTTTDTAGEVSFEGTTPSVPSGGLLIHFEIGGLSPGSWSTAGWKSKDKLWDGTISGFIGNPFGTTTAPVTFLVGIPCWLKFSYERKCGEQPPARLPSGTRIKLIALDSSDAQVDLLDFRTDSSSEVKAVLYNTRSGVDLRGLIFTRFRRALDDPPTLVLDPFAVTTGNQTSGDDAVAIDNPSPGAAKPFLYYDGKNTPDPADPNGPSVPAGYAFHLTNFEPTLKATRPWIAAVDTFSLCEWDAQAGQMSPKAIAIEMPSEFHSNKAFSAIDPTSQEKITLCTALHAATLIREFHSLISALLSPRPAWRGLNIDRGAYETTLVLTDTVGPETTEIELPSGEIRGKVQLPLACLHDPAAFVIPANDLDKYRYLNLRNVILHEVGHCLMFTYSFDSGPDDSPKPEHFLNLFVDYADLERRVVPFWEGWAIYFSMLLLGPKAFLSSQMTRVAAKDGTIQLGVELNAIESKSPQEATDAIDNIFSSGIIRSFAVENGITVNKGLPIASIVAHPALSATGLNKGVASEMCLAFSLFSLTKFLVTRQGATLTGPVASNGDGRITIGSSAWYENSAVQDDLWKAIFEPFVNLRGGGPDTVDKFITLIKKALRRDADWHKIKKIFNTYYLLIETFRITAVSPSAIQANSTQHQVLTISGRRFVDSSPLGDGGLTVQITCPSSVAQPSLIQNGMSVLVTSSKALTITAMFPEPGAYTLKFIGRWGEITKIISVNP